MVEEARAEALAPVEKIHGYVVSITWGGRHKKLHHYGACRLIPGIDYKEFRVRGDLMPPRNEVDSRCKRCFGLLASIAPAEEESAAESVDSSSSSTSGKPAPKRAKPEEPPPPVAS